MRWLVLMCCFSLAGAFAQDTPQPLPLWSGDAPGAHGTEAADIPTITPYFPQSEIATGAAVVICPGGGYGHLALKHEGADIAAWLNGAGIAAFVLQYRHSPGYAHPTPLTDVRRAVQTVRSRASEWHVDPKRIGMIGFSAGGHLTATAATQFVEGDESSDDPVERASSRPDFVILGYPVITMTDPYTHAGSRKNLLGESPDPELVKKMSAETNVTANTPPAFIVHTSEDTSVPAQNALIFYEACLNAGVPVEMHIFEKGAHGLGLAPGNPAMSAWPAQCLIWLRGRGFIE